MKTTPRPALLFRLLVVLAVPLVAASVVPAGEVDRPPEVPAGLPLAVRQPLLAKYSTLWKWADRLDVRIADFRAHCTGIPKTEPERIRKCNEEKTALDAEWQQYADALSEYEQALAAASAAQTAFETALAQLTARARNSYAADLNRLMTEVDELRPEASSAPPLTLHEAFILGLFDPQEDAEKDLVGHRSPFSGQAYEAGQIFATAPSSTGAEAVRGVLDHHTTGRFSLYTEHGRALITRLNGARIDRLTAHSNGAMVAEALIRRGMITVKELNIMGGDRALLNREGLQLLLDTGRVQRIVVWTNPGDVIPLWSSNVMANLAPFGTATPELASAAQNLARRLTGEKAGGDAVVDYRYLAGSGYDGQSISLDANFFRAHALTTYLANVDRYFQRK